MDLFLPPVCEAKKGFLRPTLNLVCCRPSPVPFVGSSLGDAEQLAWAQHRRPQKAWRMWPHHHAPKAHGSGSVSLFQVALGPSPLTPGPRPPQLLPSAWVPRLEPRLLGGHLAETEGDSGAPASVAEGGPACHGRELLPGRGFACCSCSRETDLALCSWDTGAGGKAELSKVPAEALPPSIEPFATSHSQLLSSSPGSNVCPLGPTSRPSFQSVKAAQGWEFRVVLWT